MPESLFAVLEEIEIKHGITKPEMARKLLAGVADFYLKQGWFSFPATISPETFQLDHQVGETKSDAAIETLRDGIVAAMRRRTTEPRKQGRSVRK